MPRPLARAHDDHRSVVPNARRGWPAGTIVAGIAAGAVALFLLLKAYGFFHDLSDEGIYFYMAVRTAFYGLWPYRDYFCPHPPLHILVASAVFKVIAVAYGIAHGSLAAGTALMTSGASWEEGGFAFAAGKSIPAVSTVLAGLLIFRAARRTGRVEALLALVAFLFAKGVLCASTYFTGIAEAALCTALGIAAILEGRDRLAGLAFAAGSLVAMYVAPPAAAVWFVVLLISRRRALTVALWVSIPFVVVHVGFFLVAGWPYVEQVFLYHLHKPIGVRSFSEAFWPEFRDNWFLFLALPVALLAAVLESMGAFGPRTSVTPSSSTPIPRATRRRAAASPEPGLLRVAGADLLSLSRLREDPRRQLLVVAIAAVVGSFVFILRLDPVFEFYFVMVYVGASLLAGYGYGALLRAVGLLIVRPPDTRPGRVAVACGVLLACGVAAATVGNSGFVLRRTADAMTMGAHIPEEWRDARGLGALNMLVRAVFWSEDHVIGRRYGSIARYLWRQSEPYHIPAEAAAYVREHSPRDATLFGDSSTVPLAALMSERRLAFDEADTNAMRFMSITPPATFIARLERDPPLIVLAGDDRDAFLLPEFSAWVERAYSPVDTLVDPIVGEFYLYRRNGGPAGMAPPRRGD